MFAGPNGSGKSTLKSYLPEKLLGVYLNPDEFEQGIRQCGFLDFSAYGLTTTADEVFAFFQTSEFLREAGVLEGVEKIALSDGRLNFGPVEVNSYLASGICDFLRQKLLVQKTSFTFETVM